MKFSCTIKLFFPSDTVQIGGLMATGMGITKKEAKKMALERMINEILAAGIF
jgi:hypothetical protein